MNDKIKERIIYKRTSIIQSLKKMDDICKKSLLVYDDNCFVGLITIGDIQRAIIANINLNTEIGNIVDNSTKTYASDKDSIDEIKSQMLSIRAECMPVVDKQGHLINVFFWEDIINDTYINCQEPFDLPIVIMAGGKGTRLKPLTNVFPKPLIPINEKTIIEDIMDRFVSCGSHHFYLSVNYKADFIRSFFSQLDNKDYQIDYFQEEKPLGTAGSLSLLRGKISSTFFVSNCDILIEEDYSQMLKYHRDNKNEITLVTAVKTLSIPYGIVETSDNGILESVSEKPTLDFKINTGMYVLEPNLLDEIPDNDFFHITHLIGKIKQREGRIGCFPISERSWTDVGSWEEYQRMIKK